MLICETKSSLFCHKLLLKSCKRSISTDIRPLLISSSFTYRTTSTAAAHVRYDLPPLRLWIISHSLHVLVRNDLPVIEWASFHPFCKAHSLLRKEVYSTWQQEWEFSDSASNMRFFFLLGKDRTYFRVYINFFLKQALTGHGYLHDHLFRFNLLLSLLCPCDENFQDFVHILHDYPFFTDLRHDSE